MTAPFEDREGWEMTAIPLDGSVYIELHDPPEIRAQRRVQSSVSYRYGAEFTNRRKDQSSWAWQTYMGYAYESFSTVPAVPASPREDDPEGWSGSVNTKVQVSISPRHRTMRDHDSFIIATCTEPKFYLVVQVCLIIVSHLLI